MTMLTQAERDRFAAWCEEHVASNEGLLRQLELLPGSEVIGKQMRAETAALRMVGRRLRLTEEGRVG